jgi:hypothetical protein
MAVSFLNGAGRDRPPTSGKVEDLEATEGETAAGFHERTP